MNAAKLFRMAMLVSIVFAVAEAGAFAQSPTPDPNAWVTNGAVYAIAHLGDITYIGGAFTYVGPYTGSGVPFDTATGQPAATYPKVNGSVWVSVPDGSGGWYIGGDFTQVGTTPRSNIAHILFDGTVDAWNPNADYWVSALAVSGTRIYVGGQFASVGGQTRNGLAALDATTGLATAWNPNMVGSDVYALAVSGTRVLVGGRFQNIGGQARNNIAAVDAVTGLATAWNPNANGWNGAYHEGVLALAVSGGTVFAGGTFTNIGGQARNSIAALDATTGLATAWAPSLNSSPAPYVGALAVSGSTVYAGGQFTNIGGQARNGIAALDAASGLATGWNPNAQGDNASVNALTVLGSMVYAGGTFTNIGGQARNSIAALDATTGLATGWAPSVNDMVHTLAASGTTVYVGGGFTSIGGQTRNRIAALDAAGVLTPWNPDVTGGYNDLVSALAVSGTTVYVGGIFTFIGGQARNHIAALDATTGLATDWNPDAESYVRSLAVSGTMVYVGGQFASVGGQPRSHIAALDAMTGLATDWNPNAIIGTNYNVWALAVSGTTIYAGGEFTGIGGQARNGVAALDAATGLATDWNPNPTGGTAHAVFALTVSGSTVYVGGDFTSIGGQPRNNIAAIDARTGLATGWNPNAEASYTPFVRALAVSSATVLVGGQFTSIGGQARNRIAAVGMSGNVTPWNPDANGYINALAVSGTSVYVGGTFTSIGGDYRPHYARFDIAPCLPTASFTFDDPSPTELDVVRFKVDFNEPLVAPLTADNVSLTPGSLVGSIEVSGTDPNYTVTVTLSDPDADGTVAITIPEGAVSDLDGNVYTGGSSPPYLIWNVPMPTTGPVGLAALLGLVVVGGVGRLCRR